MINENYASISIGRQCELVGISRSSYYYKAKAISPREKSLMDAIDEQYTKTPFYGTRRMAVVMTEKFGTPINRKIIRRLMHKMGLAAIYPKPNLSKANKAHKKYPYLLSNLILTGSNQVWSTDITYVRLNEGFGYLMAVIDWYSRKVIAWGISNTMDTAFCVSILKEALEKGTPMIFNTDQGSQFTSKEFTDELVLDATYPKIIHRHVFLVCYNS